MLQRCPVLQILFSRFGTDPNNCHIMMIVITFSLKIEIVAQKMIISSYCEWFCNHTSYQNNCKTTFFSYFLPSSSLYPLELLHHVLIFNALHEKNKMTLAQDMITQGVPDRRERKAVKKKGEKYDQVSGWPNYITGQMLSAASTGFWEGAVKGGEAAMKQDCSQTDCLLRNCKDVSVKLLNPRVQVESARLHRLLTYRMKRKSKINAVYWHRVFNSPPFTKWQLIGLLMANESLTDVL